MMSVPAGGLDEVVRRDRARLLAALAARLRDLDLAEEALSEAFAKAAALAEVPRDWSAWLYQTALNAARDRLRHAKHVEAHAAHTDAQEEADMDDSTIPDRRLALIFACCHPSLDATTRAALTLTTVCGLTQAEVARAFLTPAPTLAQRLVRAKRKLKGTGIAFEVPDARFWPERLSAVLATMEIAYAHAHRTASSQHDHAGYAPQMLELTALLSRLMPDQGDVHALSAIVRLCEARRPARLDQAGMLVPLSEQDPAGWDAALTRAGLQALADARHLRAAPIWLAKAELQACWNRRTSLRDPAPWPQLLSLYDHLLEAQDNPFVRLNRAVAVSEVEGPQAALDAVDALDAEALDAMPAYHALRADILAKLGETARAREAFAKAIELQSEPPERAFLQARMDALI